MSEALTVPRRGGLPASPRNIKQEQAKAEAIIAYAAKVKDWPLVEQAIDLKIEIAPDALHIRNHPLWSEYKTKTNAFDWAGGSRDQEGRRMPPCLAHGIQAHAHDDYRLANEQVPVVLWFLTLNTGMLHVGSLDELGEPFPSADPAYPIVNWPISRMKHIASFDRKRVLQFVNKPPRERLPSPQERKDLLHWLRPVQVELDGFIEHFLTVCERRWASRGTA